MINTSIIHEINDNQIPPLSFSDLVCSNSYRKCSDGVLECSYDFQNVKMMSNMTKLGISCESPRLLTNQN